MTLLSLLLQIILTIPLTIILKTIDKKTSNIVKLLLPTVYIIIIAAIIPYVKTNIFLITVFEVFIRNFYNTIILKEEMTKPNSMFIIESILSIALSLFTYNYFISKVDTVIPNPEDIKPFLWFSIFIFICFIYILLVISIYKRKNLTSLNLVSDLLINNYTNSRVNLISQFFSTAA